MIFIRPALLIFSMLSLAAAQQAAPQPSQKTIRRQMARLWSRTIRSQSMASR
jgi:hypothetical protein